MTIEELNNFNFEKNKRLVPIVKQRYKSEYYGELIKIRIPSIKTHPFFTVENTYQKEAILLYEGRYIRKLSPNLVPYNLAEFVEFGRFLKHKSGKWIKVDKRTNDMYLHIVADHRAKWNTYTSGEREQIKAMWWEHGLEIIFPYMISSATIKAPKITDIQSFRKYKVINI